MDKALSGSMEDYLEAVYVLAEQGGKVRVKHLADFLGVTRPSVVSAVAHLHDKGLVDHAPYRDVQLTAKGLACAKEIYARHVVLRRFLLEFLGLPREVAERDACRMEHLLDPRTVARVDAFLTFLEDSPETQALVTAFQSGLDDD